MKNKSGYLNKTFSAVALGTILLVNTSLVDAKEVNVSENMPVQKVNQQAVNLNTSNADGLATLKGVGQTRAQAIVLYRQQKGNFKTIDELTNISGIGQKIVNDNKARLTL